MSREGESEMGKQLLVILSIVMFSWHGTFVQSDVLRPLFTFKKLFLREDITIESVSLVARGTKTFQTKKEVELIYDEWKKVFSSFEMSVTKQENSTKTTFRSNDEVAHFIVTKEKDQYVTIVIYTLHTPVKVFDGVEKAYMIFMNRFLQIPYDLLKNIRLYSCLNGQMDDKMGGAVSEKVSSFLHTLQAEKIEEMNEETFISASAYIKYWKAFILADEQKMNVQLSMKLKKNNQINVIIGTPIITTEY